MAKKAKAAAPVPAMVGVPVAVPLVAQYQGGGVCVLARVGGAPIAPLVSGSKAEALAALGLEGGTMRSDVAAAIARAGIESPVAITWVAAGGVL